MNNRKSTNEILIKQLGVFIRGKRRLLDITQEKLAKICGLHINYINGIERGVRNPSLTTLIVLSKALGFSFDELLASLDLKNIYICKPNL